MKPCIEVGSAEVFACRSWSCGFQMPGDHGVAESSHPHWFLTRMPTSFKSSHLVGTGIANLEFIESGHPSTSVLEVEIVWGEPLS